VEVLEQSLPILILLLLLLLEASHLVSHAYLGSLLKIRILEVAPPVVTLPMVVPPYFAKPVSVLSLI
jgi:hypothetical protein